MYYVIYKDGDYWRPVVKEAATFDEAVTAIDSLIQRSVQNEDKVPPEFYGVFTDTLYTEERFIENWAKAQAVYKQQQEKKALLSKQREMRELLEQAKKTIAKADWFKKSQDVFQVGDIVFTNYGHKEGFKIIEIAGDKAPVCIIESTKTKMLLTVYASTLTKK